MTEGMPVKPYTLIEDERATLLMVYTQNGLVRGEVITRSAIRINTWLRTQAAPEYFHLYNTKVVMQGLTGNMQTHSYIEYFIPTHQVIAYHVAPPATEPYDYDTTEPNRKMEAVVAIIGTFQFKGHIRMAAHSNTSRYLETTREAFLSLYDIDIINPSLPAMGTIHTPMALLRLNSISISPLQDKISNPAT